MYRGFNLQNIDIDDKESRAEEYDRLHPNLFYSKVFASIDTFLQRDGSIDGCALIKEWFPVTEKYHIFISHSHDDIELAKALARWFEKKFSLKSFIDSTVWGDFRQLRSDINLYLKRKMGAKYNFNVYDRVYQHVNSMLHISLMEMMDRAQCMFLLNTPNSVTVNETLECSVYSPWIFSEIGMFNCIKKRKPKSVLQEAVAVTENFSTISYKVDLSRFTPISVVDLKLWGLSCKNLNNPQTCLDNLYKQKPITHVIV